MRQERTGKTQPFYEIDHSEVKNVKVYPTREKTTVAAAETIMREVHMNPTATIVYATGETMVPVYANIAKEVLELNVSFAKTRAFHLDEYWPADPEKNASFSFVHYLRELVFTPFGLKSKNVYEIDGTVKNPEKFAREYGESLRKQPVDLAILGIGPGGHIGFNERGTPFTQRTFLATLSQETVVRDQDERGLSTPNQAITLGIADILDAQKIVLIAYGEKKGEYLKEALNGSISVNCPASALRLKSDKVTIMIDQEAASQIDTP